jgi:hypothetical protein
MFLSWLTHLSDLYIIEDNKTYRSDKGGEKRLDTSKFAKKYCYRWNGSSLISC